mmetsp:Transcript_4648/g.14342  ORF Transcript_4648/g.14342 Transcript_4648/m.14342 type:complete len:243 (-) Transcript_4648:1674-2402(-)
MPECAITIPYSFAAAVTGSSWTDPPGWTRYLTPKRAATSMLSRKGKKASDARHTSVSATLRNAALSSAVSGGTSAEKFALNSSYCGAVKSPSMYATRALMRSCRFTPSLKGSASTFGCWRSAHVCALRPASFTQSTRLCCPAPTPIIWPPSAYPTEFDCVYLMQICERTRSRAAPAGSAVSVVTSFASVVFASMIASLRRCSKRAPPMSRRSRSGGSKPGCALRTMNAPFFFAERIARASGE